MHDSGQLYANNEVHDNDHTANRPISLEFCLDLYIRAGDS